MISNENYNYYIKLTFHYFKNSLILKKSTFTIYIMAISIWGFQSCSATKNLPKTDDLGNLVQSMTGSFDSQKQSEQDSAFFNISLKMYPIWQADGGNWLYVEQAVAARPQAPYRQRIYKIEQIEKDVFKSTVYRIKDEKSFIGKWAEPAYFNTYSQDILEEREGCAVFLKRLENGVYEGSTEGESCKSSLRGASYATSKVRVEKDKIISWDQGFDEKGVQVWGATKGGYVFERKE